MQLDSPCWEVLRQFANQQRSVLKTFILDKLVFNLQVCSEKFILFKEITNPPHVGLIGKTPLPIVLSLTLEGTPVPKIGVNSLQQLQIILQRYSQIAALPALRDGTLPVLQTSQVVPRHFDFCWWCLLGFIDNRPVVLANRGVAFSLIPPGSRPFAEQVELTLFNCLAVQGKQFGHQKLFVFRKISPSPTKVTAIIPSAAAPYSSHPEELLNPRKQVQLAVVLGSRPARTQTVCFWGVAHIEATFPCLKASHVFCIESWRSLPMQLLGIAHSAPVEGLFFG